jgi:hypothetical protein
MSRETAERPEFSSDVTSTVDLHPELAARALTIGLHKLGFIPESWAADTVRIDSPGSRLKVTCKPTARQLEDVLEKS